MNPGKRTEMINGSPVRPIRIGRKAIIVHNGKLLHTATVTGIQEYSADAVCFETPDANYRISLSGHPFAAAALYAAA